MRAFLTWSVLVFALASVVGRCPAADPPPEHVRITVVAVLATKNDTVIDPKLKCLAAEVQKKDPTLTGFSLGKTSRLDVALNGCEKFMIDDELEACIHVQRCKEHSDHYCLKVKSGTLVGEITYTAACSKYFPLLTGYSPKKGEGRLILAIMVEACPEKEKEKDK